MTYDELMQSILTAREEMLKCGIEANSVTLNGRKYGKLIENLPFNMKPTIFGMAVKAEYAMPDDYNFLVQYEPTQPQTNADRIRSMSDEELAKLFVSGWYDGPLFTCPVSDIECDKSVSCDVCFLEWLKATADKEGEG